MLRMYKYRLRVRELMPMAACSKLIVLPTINVVSRLCTSIVTMAPIVLRFSLFICITDQYGTTNRGAEEWTYV
jgi:hypothetical protein